MRMSEESFWKNSFVKNLDLIDLHFSLHQQSEYQGTEVKEIQSMKEIEGW